MLGGNTLEGKGSYFLLLVIVAFLSISLALLAIGYFVFGNHSSTTPEKEVVVVKETVPSDEELSNKVIFEKTNFNLKKTSDNQIAVIVLSASMKHFKEVDEMKEVAITAKIDFYSKEINSAIGTYFQGLTLDDVRQVDAKKKASEELKKTINEILEKNETKKNVSPIVYSITFDYWFYQ